MTCDIDTCREAAAYTVEGHPDDVNLCAVHLEFACDCLDGPGGHPDPWCRLHGTYRSVVAVNR